MAGHCPNDNETGEEEDDDEDESKEPALQVLNVINTNLIQFSLRHIPCVRPESMRLTSGEMFV